MTEAEIQETVMEQASSTFKLLPDEAERVMANTFRIAAAHNLGIIVFDEMAGREVVSVMISQNTPLPFEFTDSFGTHGDFQDSAMIRVVQGESDDPAACTLLGDGVIKFPQAVPKDTEVAITFRLGEDGTLQVSSVQPQTGTTNDFTIDNVESMGAEDRAAAEAQVGALKFRG